MSELINGVVQATRGSTSDWAASLTPLAEGEVGYNTETGESAVGDGTSLWADLAKAVTVDPATGKLPSTVLTGIASDVEDSSTVIGAAVEAVAGVPYDSETGLYNEASNHPIPSIDASTRRLPDLVRAQLAMDLADSTSLEGAAVASSVSAVTLPIVGKSRTNSFVFIGDSITAFGNVATTTAGNRTRIEASYMHWIQIHLKHRLHILASMGVSGESIAQIKVRVPDAIATGAKNLFLLGGINSIKAGVSYASIIADYQEIYAMCAAAGVTVFHATVTPIRSDLNSYPAVWDQVNAWIMDEGAATPGVIVIPWHNAIIDPSTGNPIASTVADGLHPNVYGANLLGKFAADFLDPLFRDTSNALTVRYSDATNALTNGFMTGTGGLLSGTANDGVASSWTVNPTGDQTVTVSKVARDDGFGEWQQIQITGGTATVGRDAGVQLYQKMTGLPETADSTLAFNRSDMVYAQVEFETDEDFINASQLQLMLRDDSYTFLSRVAATDATWLKVGGAIKGILRTEPTPASSIPFKSGTTPNRVSQPLTAYLSVAGLTGGTTATIRLGRFSVAAARTSDGLM